MTARGCYRLAKASIPEFAGRRAEASDYGCVLLHTGSTYVYLHSALYPNEALEALGAVGLGGSWQQAWTWLGANANTVRDRIFYALVSRTEDGRIVQRWIPRADVLGTDTTLSDRLPPHKFAGDEDPEAVEP